MTTILAIQILTVAALIGVCVWGARRDSKADARLSIDRRWSFRHTGTPEAITRAFVEAFGEEFTRMYEEDSS